MKGLILFLALAAWCFSPLKAQTFPTLTINDKVNHKVAKAYRIALGDLATNSQKYKGESFEKRETCILAGLAYSKPWTRDAAINVWNGGGLLIPEISKNTLFSQTRKNDDGETIISGQYWDKIIWAIGAWRYYLYTHDREFLAQSYEIVKQTLTVLEAREQDDATGLFRGPAVYGDGVAAYPIEYTLAEDTAQSGSYSGILDWLEHNPSKKLKKGHGIPMMALSTNCVYYECYRVLTLMEKALTIKSDPQWLKKARALKSAINDHFWSAEKKSYKYLLGPYPSDYQEGLGLAFSLLFRISSPEQTENIFKNVIIEPRGIPCVYPSFPRYRIDSLSYGRHSGTIWPHVQGFWADACARQGRFDLFQREFDSMTENAIKTHEFREIYHPKTGSPYGGLQEPHLKDTTEWFCGERQTWSATAYLRVVLFSMIGTRFHVDGISFSPFLPDGINRLQYGDLPYLDMVLEMDIQGPGKEIKSFEINGTPSSPFIPSTLKGKIKISITLEN